jgi:hypothetical protein
VKGDTSIADQLKQNRAALKAALTSMGTASALVATPHVLLGADAATPLKTANFQLIGTTNDSIAHAEFLAQCKFVQQSLEIQGKPFRNFNLFLQIVDLNGAPIDSSATSPGSIPVGPQPYSYVEGMRQLAIGLNMLAQVIKKHQNVYVVVVAEGGRSPTLIDDKVSHCFVMGPGGPGNLKDFLYANSAAIDSTSDVYLVNPNEGNGDMTGGGQRIPDGDVVASEAGTTIKEHMTTGAILNGVLRHIETKRGVQGTTALGLGKFVRIQTA